MKNFDIEPDKIYGFLKAIEPTNQRKHNCIVWKCECVCGNIHYVRSDALRNGSIKSCGCKHVEQAEKHALEMYKNNVQFDTNIGRILKNRTQKNNTSGYKGVTWHKKSKKWRVRIFFQKKIYYLGYYDDIKKAAQAYENAREQLHGEFLEWYKKNYGKNDKEKICFCGNGFNPTTNQKYCSKECARIAKNIRQEKWQNDNPEKVKASQTKYDYKFQNRKYYLEHRDEILEKSKERSKNKSKKVKLSETVKPEIDNPKKQNVKRDNKEYQNWYYINVTKPKRQAEKEKNEK